MSISLDIIFKTVWIPYVYVVQRLKTHYLLHCQYYSEHRINLINSVESISDDFESFSDNVQRDILLYGDSRFETNKNKLILEATIWYIKNTDRFAGSLSAWVFSCKFAAYFHNTFSKDHLWMAASEARNCIQFFVSWTNFIGRKCTAALRLKLLYSKSPTTFQTNIKFRLAYCVL